MYSVGSVVTSIMDIPIGEISFLFQKKVVDIGKLIIFLDILVCIKNNDTDLVRIKIFMIILFKEYFSIYFFYRV